MQRLEASGAVRPIYGLLGVKRVRQCLDKFHRPLNVRRIVRLRGKWLIEETFELHLLGLEFNGREIKEHPVKLVHLFK